MMGNVGDVDVMGAIRALVQATEDKRSAELEVLRMFAILQEKMDELQDAIKMLNESVNGLIANSREIKGQVSILAAYQASMSDEQRARLERIQEGMVARALGGTGPLSSITVENANIGGDMVGGDKQ